MNHKCTSVFFVSLPTSDVLPNVHTLLPIKRSADQICLKHWQTEVYNPMDKFKKAKLVNIEAEA
jgi:hypothetical protein